VNVGLTSGAKNPQPNTQNKEDKTTTTINSPRLAFNISKEVAVGKTLATLGNGTVTITDTANSSDTTHLNRDVTKADKELYSSSAGTSVDATLDTRMLTKEGRAQIKQQYKDMDKNMNTIAQTLPNAKSDNLVEAVAGTVWNTLATVSGGILPTESNHGGLLANIPIITGYEDSNFKVTGDLSSTLAYLNGQSNTLPDAIEGGNNLIGDVPHQNWYNPTHGIIGDTLESATDILLNQFGIQTGISKQEDVLQNNGIAWTIYMHSQGNITAKAGANTKTNKYYSYGSPLPSSVVKEIFNTEAKKNDGDYVANPQNIIIPTTWFEPGHGTENYGAAKEAKEKNLNKKEK
jgi:filamentous hemagglutinin